MQAAMALLGGQIQYHGCVVDHCYLLCPCRPVLSGGANPPDRVGTCLGSITNHVMLVTVHQNWRTKHFQPQRILVHDFVKFASLIFLLAPLLPALAAVCKRTRDNAWQVALKLHARTHHGEQLDHIMRCDATHTETACKSAVQLATLQQTEDAKEFFCSRSIISSCYS